MSKIAKPRVIANGIYDDSEAALAAIELAWPPEWKDRVSREQIVTECWELTCAKYKSRLPFVRNLTLCVRLSSYCLYFTNWICFGSG
jgi:hypothetical protein